MPVDPLRLLDWPIPDARHCYTRRDTALYALSVGVGQDTADAHQRALVDPWDDGLNALPSMAMVLGYPGFWLGDPKVAEATGVTPRQVLHAEQSFELHALLPAADDVVGRTRVLGLVDRGVGRGSMLYSERTIERSVDGKLLATSRQVHYLRDVSGYGNTGFTPPKRTSIPLDKPHATIDLPTRPEQALLYRLNGDNNPLHFDPETARKAGFERPLLHGMCTAAVVLHAVLKLLADYNTTRLRSVTLRMTAPVLPGDTIRTAVWRDGSFRAYAVERSTLVIDNGHACIK